MLPITSLCSYDVIIIQFLPYFGSKMWKNDLYKTTIISSMLHDRSLIFVPNERQYYGLKVAKSLKTHIRCPDREIQSKVSQKSGFFVKNREIGKNREIFEILIFFQYFPISINKRNIWCKFEPKILIFEEVRALFVFLLFYRALTKALEGSPH